MRPFKWGQTFFETFVKTIDTWSNILILIHRGEQYGCNEQSTSDQGLQALSPTTDKQATTTTGLCQDCGHGGCFGNTLESDNDTVDDMKQITLPCYTCNTTGAVTRMAQRADNGNDIEITEHCTECHGTGTLHYAECPKCHTLHDISEIEYALCETCARDQRWAK